jgi:hypothetical protein
MQLERPYGTLSIDTSKRIAPLEFDFCKIFRYFTTLSIPSGYKVSYLPPDSKFNMNGLSYTVSYREESGKLICLTEIAVERLLVERDSFMIWNQFIKAMDKAGTETVTLTKI